MKVLEARLAVIPFLGRLLIAYIYLTSGLAKVFDWTGNVEYMQRHHLPFVPLLLAVALVIELAGSASLVTGYQARVAAFVLFLYTIVLTVLLHNYWAASGMSAAMQETEFRKNLAIAGGLLVLAYAGPGAWALRSKAARASDAVKPATDAGLQ